MTRDNTYGTAFAYHPRSHEKEGLFTAPLLAFPLFTRNGGTWDRICVSTRQGFSSAVGFGGR